MPKNTPPAIRSSSETKPWYQRRFEVSQRAGCLFVSAFIVMAVLVMALTDEGAESGQQGKAVDLGASVLFTGTQFVVTNTAEFDWSNCELEINGGFVRGGYEKTEPLIKARTSYTIGAMQFAKSSGERFNPSATKPRSFQINCDTPSGEGFDFREWQ